MFKEMIIGKIKESAKKIEGNLNRLIDTSLQAIAESKDIPGYDLELLVVEENGVAEGCVYFNGEQVDKIDVVGMLKDLFDAEMANIPKVGQMALTKMMGGDSIDGLIMKLLQSGQLKCKYNEDDEIVSYKIIDGKEELLDISEFISSID